MTWSSGDLQFNFLHSKLYIATRVSSKEGGGGGVPKLFGIMKGVQYVAWFLKTT